MYMLGLGKMGKGYIMKKTVIKQNLIANQTIIKNQSNIKMLNATKFEPCNQIRTHSPINQHAEH